MKKGQNYSKHLWTSMETWFLYTTTKKTKEDTPEYDSAFFAFNVNFKNIPDLWRTYNEKSYGHLLTSNKILKIVCLKSMIIEMSRSIFQIEFACDLVIQDKSIDKIIFLKLISCQFVKFLICCDISWKNNNHSGFFKK